MDVVDFNKKYFSELESKKEELEKKKEAWKVIDQKIGMIDDKIEEAKEIIEELEDAKGDAWSEIDSLEQGCNKTFLNWSPDAVAEFDKLDGPCFEISKDDFLKILKVIQRTGFVHLTETEPGFAQCLTTSGYVAFKIDKIQYSGNIFDIKIGDWLEVKDKELIERFLADKDTVKIKYSDDYGCYLVEDVGMLLANKEERKCYNLDKKQIIKALTKPENLQKRDFTNDIFDMKNQKMVIDGQEYDNKPAIVAMYHFLSDVEKFTFEAQKFESNNLVFGNVNGIDFVSLLFKI